MPSCITAPITPYVPDQANPWDETRIKHFYNAIGFGANKSQIDQAIAQDPVTFIENLVNAAAAKPPQPAPEWAFWRISQFDPEDPYAESWLKSAEWMYEWINIAVEDPLREKMLLFWSNHFVTKFESYGVAPWLYEYHEILQRNALGNFKTLTREVGLCSAMLVFLNGVQNYKSEPNENYARELLELFTLGLDNNYTENDIREIARAFTGYNDAPYTWQRIGFLPAAHDDGPKTIFGKTANYDYDGVIDLLFDERPDEIAKYICTKIYKQFVSYEINEEIIDELAVTFKAANWELAPVFRQLFTSAHFFDEKAINNKIKSHVEYFGQFLNLFNYKLKQEDAESNTGQAFLWYCGSLGQSLFDPVDVAGWKGDKAWIDSGSLLVRWLYTGWFFGFLCDRYAEQVVGFMKEVTNNSNDVTFVAHTLADYFLVKPLNSPSDYDKLVIAFKGDIPQNYFDQGLWNLDWDYVQWQFYNMMETLKTLPDINLA